MENQTLLPFEKRLLTKKIVVKGKEEPRGNIGKDPSDRTTSELLQKGVLILNKPSGPTSHQAVDYLKRIIEKDKAGHSGTLDPGVTGVLPVAIQDATRITNALLSAGKEYVCLMHIHADITRQQLDKVIGQFTGTITQLPPKKSAVKRQNRQRTIYYMEILEIQDKDVLFRVGCQGGTYIRKLVHDMGQRLGCGAHMVELVRTKAGPFTESQMHTLQDITDAYHYYKNGNDYHLKKMLLPIEAAVGHMKKMWIYDEAIKPVSHGMSLKVPGIYKLDSDIKRNDAVAVMSIKGELVLVGDALLSTDEIMKMDKGIAIKTSQVFVQM